MVQLKTYAVKSKVAKKITAQRLLKSAIWGLLFVGLLPACQLAGQENKNSNTQNPNPEISTKSPKKQANNTSTAKLKNSLLNYYFLKIAMGSEFGASEKRIKKWTQDIKVFVKKSRQPKLESELDRILAELNALSTSIIISRVSQESQSNFVIFFSSADEYARYEPSAKPYLKSNWGLVWINWNKEWQINRGSMYIDIHRTSDLQSRRHLLREELTQGLGLLNDSYDFKDSIFYQGWTSTTEYSPIDRQVIRLILSPAIEAGMNSAAAEKVILNQAEH